MPYHIASSAECPDDKPYAVVKDADGSILGCHETPEDAAAQIAAVERSEAAVRWKAKK